MPKKIENEEKKIITSEKDLKKGKATEKKKVDSNKAKIKKALDKKKVEEKVTKKTSTKSKEKEVINNKTSKAKTGKKVSKTETKKTTKKSKTDNVENTKIEKVEYYDLPYRYNETIVTILAQTPKRLFVYWDISDNDREMYKKAFGEDFFEKTYPVLLVHNEEMNYTFEVPINDFANSWYLDIQDSKKKYVVQLGRKFRNVEQTKYANYEVIREENISLQNDFVYITDSNKLEAPNDHILFELLSNQVKYRNVKTGYEFQKDLKDLVKDLSNVYPDEAVHNLYTKLYSDEIAGEEFGRKNPGSSDTVLPSSSGALRSSGQW